MYDESLSKDLSIESSMEIRNRINQLGEKMDEESKSSKNLEEELNYFSN